MTSASVVVVGDVMLDVFSEGSVSRLSPEAPVPVLANPVNREVLGGAGNTALNVLTLGAEAALIAVVGVDPAGADCERLLAESGIRSALVVDEGGVTTTKTRYLTGSHQMLRLDVERPHASDQTQAQLLAAVEERVDSAACLVVSDYQKGVIDHVVARHVMARAASAGVPVVVDSKVRDFAIFRGATVIAPNIHEATQATGLVEPEAAARALADKTKGAVIVTLGPDGMLVLENGVVSRVASRVREVADVTGAGDTVTAALAVALSEGASIVDAAHWATAAAAVAVERRGTYAVTRAELDGVLAEDREMRL